MTHALRPLRRTLAITAVLVASMAAPASADDGSSPEESSPPVAETAQAAGTSLLERWEQSVPDDAEQAITDPDQPDPCDALDIHCTPCDHGVCVMGCGVDVNPRGVEKGLEGTVQAGCSTDSGG